MINKRKMLPQLFNKLGEDFLHDLYEDWQEHGRKALADTREQNPAAYLKIVASLLPKETHPHHLLDCLKEMSQDELEQKLKSIRREREKMVKH
jgi:hypothetical protein